MREKMVAPSRELLLLPLPRLFRFKSFPNDATVQPLNSRRAARAMLQQSLRDSPSPPPRSAIAELAALRFLAVLLGLSEWRVAFSTGFIMVGE